MKKVYNITEIRFEDDILIIKVDNQILRIKVKDISEKLAKATNQERNDFKVSPSGYGIHWELIDEDLSINGLLELDKSRHAL